MDGGNENILANWPNDKHIICNTNNYIPESLAACDTKISKLIMYFTINTAFTNYLEMFLNFTDSLQTQLIRNRTTFKQTLPITLNVSLFDKSLLHTSTDLKDFVN